MANVQTTATPGLASQSGGLAGSIWGAQRNAPSGIAGLVGNTGAFGAYKPIAANMSTPNGVAIGSASSTPNMSLLSGPMSTPNAPKTQDVKKVTTAGDGTQEVHYYPSTSQSSPQTQTVQGGILTAPGYSASNLPPGATQSVVSQNPPVNQTGQGTFTTPNGAIVDAQGNIIKQSPMVASPTTDTGAPSFPGLVNLGAQAAQQSTTIGQNAANIATDYAKQIKDAGIQAALSQEGLLTTGGPSAPLQGNALAQAQLGAAREQALGTAESAALAGTGQQLTAQQQASQGLLSAAGQVAPSTAAYGQTVFNPATGQFQSPSGTGLLDPETLANQLAPLVASGQLNINDATSQMTGGVAGSTALRNAILKINPNFNFNLSASSATTQAAGQQLKTQSNTVNQALDTLTGFFNQLSPLQTQGIPLTNDIAQSIGQAFGSSTVSQYKTALADARNQVQAILGTVGVTPTDAKQYTDIYLPDGMNAEQLPANIAALKTLIGQKVQNYTASGQQPSAQSQSQNAQSTTSNSIFSW